MTASCESTGWGASATSTQDHRIPWSVRAKLQATNDSVMNDLMANDSMTGDPKMAKQSKRFRELRDRIKSAGPVPLSDAVMDLLASLPRFDDGDFLFSVSAVARDLRHDSRARREKQPATSYGAAITTIATSAAAKPASCHVVRRSFRIERASITVAAG